MNRLQELDPYWIAERYHNGHTKEDFIHPLRDRGISWDDADILWKIIDAAVDICPDRAAEDHGAGGTIAQQPQVDITADDELNDSIHCRP